MKRRVLAAAAFAALLPTLLATAPANAVAPAATAQFSLRAVDADDWPVVNRGDKGVDVTTIQYLLTAHGFATGVDGDFGPATEAAVKRFQTAKSLESDGDVGPKTWSKLIIQVKKGSTGNAVKAAQTQLKANGHNVAVDGDFGSGTDSATRAFQTKVKLTSDGIIGPNTWAALVSGNGGGTTPPPTGGSRAELARQLLDSPDTVFLRSHVSGNNHYASTAGGNIESTSRGEAAALSPWGDAYQRGQRTVVLNLTMLQALVKLDTQKGFSYRVTSIAGGDHSSNSRHYKGRGVDFDTINGRRVGSGAAHSSFMAACRDLGATEVLGPGDDGHSTHVHCGW